MNRAVIYHILAAFFLAVSMPVYAQQLPKDGLEESLSDWNIIESRFATICVDKEMDIGMVSSRIDTSFARFDPVERRLFQDKGIIASDILANKIDIIVRKAMNILDMRPENFHTYIKVYENEVALWATYEEIFKERENYRAFYIHKFEAIYISYENLGENVLAHEIGHSIIDNYFNVLPPYKIRELLACYVDVHLKD